jgi:hypothetical protein
MIEISTSINELNYEQSNQQALEVSELGSKDLTFYNNIKFQLDDLKREPSEETVARILAYSRKV